MDDPDSDNELNVYFGMAQYDDIKNNEKEEIIPREKVQPIQKTNKNK